MTQCISQGQPLPAELVGEFRDSADVLEDTPELQRRFEEDGYLFVRAAVDRDLALAAREEVFERLAEVGEIEQPAIDGIFTDRSQRRELHPDLGAFWQSVSEGPALRLVSHGPQLRGVVGKLLGEEARPHDFLFLRVSVVGRATNLHYDRPFFARGSQRICTAWTALGDIPVSDGPLIAIEGSNRFDDLIEQAWAIDYDSKDSPVVSILDDVATLAKKRQTRLLTADFQPGDVVLFSMKLLHGTLDNHSPIGRVRLSFDVRYQPAADPLDERYFGPNPTGTTGIGYAELNGAKPLTEPWHTR